MAVLEEMLGAILGTEWALWMVALVVLSSMLAGYLAGLLGIGGGVILVPALSIVFEAQGLDAYAMHIAVGTSLAVIIPTGLTSAISHAKRGALHQRAFFNWAPGIVIGTALGSYCASLLNADQMKLFFACAVAFLALMMHIDPSKIARYFGKEVKSPDSQDDMIALTAIKKRILNGGGVIVGAVATLMGIGGATMTVPAMSMLGLHIRHAIGTASALGVMIAIPGTLGFIVIGLDDKSMIQNLGVERSAFMLGYVHLALAAMILPICMIFARVGVKAAHRLKGKKLKSIFAIFLIFIAAEMLYAALF